MRAGRDVVGGGAPPVFRPALLADQRDEHHGAPLLFLERAVGPARDLEQRLPSLFRLDRNDETAANRELSLERFRNRRPTGGDQDGIERCRLGPAQGAVADAQLDAVVSERAEAPPRGLGERRMALDRMDPAGDARQHGGRVA